VNPRITIGVDDVERSLTFYREGLGPPMRRIIGTEVEAMALSHCSISRTA
jgi:catechol 2,3-dioxygenase-like lactoylglutathione lyase family enzyme